MFQAELKGRKRPISQLRVIKQEEFPLPQVSVSFFLLVRPLADWMRPNHIKEVQSALLSLLVHMLISSKSTLTEIPRIMFEQISELPMAQSS